MAPWLSLESGCAQYAVNRGKRLRGVADQNIPGRGCMQMDYVEHPVEPFGGRGVGAILWILAVDEAADSDAVVLLIGQFSLELCVTGCVVGEREVPRAQPRALQVCLDCCGYLGMLAKSKYAPAL